LLAGVLRSALLLEEGFGQTRDSAYNLRRPAAERTQPAPGRAQMRVGQISFRCLGKSTVAKRGKGDIVAQLGGSDDLLDVAGR
jgi:hypothetical protein